VLQKKKKLKEKMKSEGISNPTFDASSTETIVNEELESNENLKDIVQGRGNWGRGIEFLLSCIAMSVGLGNVWRFPFIALANGGGMYITYIVDKIKNSK
jgi:solute carrier family 6 (neurotransmitter transporter, glycine) member 5/9